MAVITTWIWTEFVDIRVTLGFWTAAAAIWLVATVSAVSAFPPPLARRRDAATEQLFVDARDAYLARNWLTAETKLRALLAIAPTDGEAQLLFGTLLRRAGRFAEARNALEKLARSDAGGPWRHPISRELQCLARDERDERDENDRQEDQPTTALSLPDAVDQRRTAA